MKSCQTLKRLKDNNNKKKLHREQCVKISFVRVKNMLKWRILIGTVLVVIPSTPVSVSPAVFPSSELNSNRNCLYFTSNNPTNKMHCVKGHKAVVQLFTLS
jgi:hypothetical protein